ncbi:HGxxPAAW family protein [Propionicicella superfundia]|uniref:HGxxPAAW family protein n=1 Tax=Propionicicella superfundia TaxID=348582 RepID=UPI0004243476|nr:HGxxPAAW family protein [Propionicicella superfundia]
MSEKREYHHGKSPAAIWGSALAAVGFVVAAVGFMMPLNWVVVGIGGALVLFAMIVGGTLRAAGFGQ